MTFATSIHCMDGRIQAPLQRYFRDKFKIRYMDAITEPGPCKIIAEQRDDVLLKSIHDRVHISVHHHGSGLIAISGHYDCAGNPVSKEEQLDQLIICKKRLDDKYPDITVVKLWINDDWDVEEVS